MKNTLLILSTIALAFTACKKDDDNGNPTGGGPGDSAQVSAFDYLPKTKGSYWIYENYRINPDSTVDNLNQLDSAYVVGDTVIDGITYTGYYNLTPHYDHQILYIRDDNGDLKNSSGSLLSSTNRETNSIDNPHYYIYNNTDTFYSAYTKSYLNQSVTVPAGTFNNAVKTVATFNIHESKWHPDKPNVVTEERFYAKGVGIAKHEYFYFSGRDRMLYRTLVRYHIEK